MPPIERPEDATSIPDTLRTHDTFDPLFEANSGVPTTGATRTGSGSFPHAEELPGENPRLREALSDRRQTEAALAESEARFRALWASAPVAVSVSRIGRHLFVNPAFLAAFGYSPDTDLTETSIEEQIAPSSRNEIADRVRRRAAGESVPNEYETRMRRVDGSEFLAGVRIASMTLPDGPATLCFLTDITQRRWVEERDRFLIALDDALRPLSEPDEITLTAARLLGEHLAVDRCAYADIEADEDTMNLTGNYMRHAGIRSIVGRMRFSDFGAEVLALMKADKPFVVEDVDTHIPPIGDTAAYRATQIQAVICVPLHKRGRFVGGMAVHNATPRRWTDGEVELVRLVAARCWESIERARVARNLRESEARFRLMANVMPQIVWITDADGRTEFFNEQWSLYTGSPYEPTTATQIAGNYVHPDDGAATLRAFEKARRTGTSFAVEHRIRSATGEYRWFLVRAEPYRDPTTGEIVRWFGASTDIHDRREVEEALRASETRYRTLFESVDEGFCVIEVLFDAQDRPTDYRFVEVNPAFERQTGLINAVGRTMRELVPDMDDSWFHIYGRVVRAGESVRFENHAPAMERWFDVYAQRVGTPEEHRVGVLFRDSTDRKRAEAALREGEERSRNILESISDAFFALDRNWHFTYVNRQAERILDRASGDLLGKRIWEEYPGTLGSEFERAYRDAADKRVSSVVTAFYPDHDRWYEAHVYPSSDGITVYFRDVTDMKRAEAILRESEAQFREIADTAPAMLWITDAAHDCTFLSRGWYEYTGQTEAEAMGMGWTLATHPDDRERAARTFLKAAEHRQPFRLEYRLQTADGSYRWALDAGQPRLSPSGEFLGFIGSVIDIHDRRLAEQETERGRALLDAVLDALPVGVIIAEPDGRLVRWNRSNEALWGMPAGTKPTDTASMEQYGEWKGWWPDTGQRIRAEEWAMARALRNREVVTGEVVEIEPFNDAGRRFIVNTAAPVLDDAGQVIAGVVAQTDVTARRETERRERFLADLSDRLHALEGGDDPDDPLGEAVRAAGEFLRVSRCGIRSVNSAAGVAKPGREWQRDARVTPVPAIDHDMSSFGAFSQVDLLSGKTVVVDDTQTDPRLTDDQTRAAYSAFGIAAFVSAPLMRNGVCVSLFNVHDDRPHAWTTNEIDLIESVAERAWLAAENARLHREREEEARKNERIAETLQRSLLVAPDPAQLVGWDVATEYQAAWDEALIGGDFYDAFPLDGAAPGDPPRTALVVGDATGKGLQAAQHTAEVKYALRAFLRENPDPGVALARLNDLACAGSASTPAPRTLTSLCWWPFWTRGPARRPARRRAWNRP